MTTTVAASCAQVADRFLELCNQGKNFDFMHAFYGPDIVSVEGDGSETAGKGPVIKKSEDFGVVNRIDSQVIHGPFFGGPRDADGQFAVHFIFEVTPKDGGKQFRREEVALYTVTNGLVTREQFFY